LWTLNTSEYCCKHDLVGPFTLFIATGLRRGELLGLRWGDFDETEGTIAVTGKVERIAGQSPDPVEVTKTAAGRRTLALPSYAVDALRQRRSLPFLGEHPVIIFRPRRAHGATRTTSAGNGARSATSLGSTT
jgi:integrase